MWYWGAPSPEDVVTRSEDSAQVAQLDALRSVDAELAWDAAAKAYVDALQAGLCDPVIDRTWWIQERLEYVQRTEGQTAAERAYEEQCEELLTRTAEGNQLTNEGIEDKYIFVPGAEIGLLKIDGGRSDLAKPVASRSWIRVTFPTEYRAPRDRAGNAIRRIRVGLNVSSDGYVLKAGVRGNVEIDWESISTAWKNQGD